MSIDMQLLASFLSPFLIQSVWGGALIFVNLPMYSDVGELKGLYFSEYRIGNDMHVYVYTRNMRQFVESFYFFKIHVLSE